jgi:hypothetical protein
VNKNENQLALKYFGEQVLPILNDKSELDKVIEQSLNNSNQSSENSHLYHLAKTILLFENQEETMEKFKDRVIEIVNVEKIGPLISTFVKEPVVFKSCESIRVLVEYRGKWLENKISQKPKFNWNMSNATFPQYPQVENFLRSGHERMNLVGVFAGIADARRFANSYNNRVQSGFSINSVPMGVGRKAFVAIMKTRDYYDKQVSLFAKFEQDLQKIVVFLN